MQRVASSILLCLFLFAAQPRPARTQPHPEEVDTAKLVAFNVALTGAFAVGRRLVEGEVDSWKDALETFVYGSVGGYGFYQAKRLVGDRKPLFGLGLAYLSASVVENAARGRHPLAYLRVGTGPADLRWRTPLARVESGPPLTLEVNLISAVSLVLLPLFDWQPFFRNGMLYYRKNTSVGSTIGRTFNRTMLLFEESWDRPQVRAHETIHFIQALQVGVVTPSYRLSALWPGLDRSLGGVLAWDVQLDWLYATFAPVTLLLDYQDRWSEVEAYTLDHPERDYPEQDGSDWCKVPPSAYCTSSSPPQ